MNDLNYSNYFTYKDEVSRSISWGHWFVLLNILLALLIGVAYLYNAPAPSTFVGTVYLIISWLGHFSFLVFVIYILIFFPLAFLCRSTVTYRVLAIILATALVLLLLVDVKLYQIIKIHLHFSYVRMFFEQKGFSTGVNFNFLYIAAPLVAAVEVVFSNLAWKNHYLHRFQRATVFLTSVFILSFLFTHIMHIWANAYRYVPITQQKSIFPAYYPMTANTMLREHGFLIPDRTEGDTVERKNVSSSQILRYPLTPLRVQPSENPRGIILITVNGLTYANMTGGNMPNLDAFASAHDSYIKNYVGNGDRWLNAFEMMYGIPAEYAGTARSEKYLPVILNEMHQQDYKISTFITGKLPAGTVRMTEVSGIRDKNIRQLSSDAQTVRSAIKWMADEDWDSRPQFMLISLNFTSEAEPEAEPEDGGAESAPAPRENSRRHTVESFYRSLRNTDRLLGDLFQVMKGRQILRNAVVIITSTGGWSPESLLPGAATGYTRESHHVPLVISWPDTLIPAKISAVTSVQDIAPTIGAEVLGIKNPEDDYSTGINLREIENRPWVVSGTRRNLHLIGLDRTTIFGRHGNSVEYTDDNADHIPPDVSMLINAMKKLNRFSN